MPSRALRMGDPRGCLLGAVVSRAPVRIQRIRLRASEQGPGQPAVASKALAACRPQAARAANDAKTGGVRVSAHRADACDSDRGGRTFVRSNARRTVGAVVRAMNVDVVRLAEGLKRVLWRHGFFAPRAAGAPGAAATGSSRRQSRGARQAADDLSDLSAATSVWALEEQSRASGRAQSSGRPCPTAQHSWTSQHASGPPSFKQCSSHPDDRFAGSRRPRAGRSTGGGIDRAVCPASGARSLVDFAEIAALHRVRGADPEVIDSRASVFSGGHTSISTARLAPTATLGGAAFPGDHDAVVTPDRDPPATESDRVDVTTGFGLQRAATPRGRVGPASQGIRAHVVVEVDAAGRSARQDAATRRSSVRTDVQTDRSRVTRPTGARASAPTRWWSRDANPEDHAASIQAYRVGGAMTVWQPVSTSTLPPVATVPQVVVQRRISVGFDGLS